MIILIVFIDRFRAYSYGKNIPRHHQINFSFDSTVLCVTFLLTVSCPVQSVEARPGCVASFLASLTLCCSHSADETLFERCLELAVPWCMGQHFNTRLYAQVRLDCSRRACLLNVAWSLHAQIRICRSLQNLCVVCKICELQLTFVCLGLSANVIVDLVRCPKDNYFDALLVSPVTLI